MDQASIGEFIENAPEGYCMMGFWGHGVNSYAFYFVAADSWRRVYLRLPYGGAYMDNAETASLIRAYLTEYAKFEKRLCGEAASLVAVESMGTGHYTVVLKDGRSFEYCGSTLQEPCFADHLGRCVQALWPRGTSGACARILSVGTFLS